MIHKEQRSVLLYSGYLIQGQGPAAAEGSPAEKQDRGIHSLRPLLEDYLSIQKGGAIRIQVFPKDLTFYHCFAVD